MTLRQIGAVVVCAFALSISAAEATQRQKHPHAQPAGLVHCAADQSYRSVCPGEATRTTARASRTAAPVETYREASIVGGRPAGCPRRYCGCGVSLKVFGRIIPELNLAANWMRKFPRARPAAGMVAARRGHVFYIAAYDGGGTALAYDPNSGGGKTRIHERSLAGYVVVDPHGSRVALQ